MLPNSVAKVQYDPVEQYYLEPEYDLEACKRQAVEVAIRRLVETYRPRTVNLKNKEGTIVLKGKLAGFALEPEDKLEPISAYMLSEKVKKYKVLHETGIRFLSEAFLSRRVNIRGLKFKYERSNDPDERRVYLTAYIIRALSEEAALAVFIDSLLLSEPNNWFKFVKDNRRRIDASIYTEYQELIP